MIEIRHYPSLVSRTALVCFFSLLRLRWVLFRPNPCLLFRRLLLLLKLTVLCSSLSGRKWSSWAWSALWFWSSSLSSFSHRHSKITPISVTPPTLVIYSSVTFPLSSLIPASRGQASVKHPFHLSLCPPALPCSPLADGRVQTLADWKRVFLWSTLMAWGNYKANLFCVTGQNYFVKVRSVQINRPSRSCLNIYLIVCTTPKTWLIIHRS